MAKSKKNPKLEVESKVSEQKFKDIIEKVSTGNIVYYRTYSRKDNGKREKLTDTLERGVEDIIDLGKLDKEEADLLKNYVYSGKVTPSGRWLWVGGTEHIKNPDNYYSAYNCSAVRIEDWGDHAINFDLLHQGCGVGSTLTQEEINNFPKPNTELTLNIINEPGEKYNPDNPVEHNKNVSYSVSNGNGVIQVFSITVADTRKGWTKAFHDLLTLTTSGKGSLSVNLDFGYVRPSGSPIKGFGGVANPEKLVWGFKYVVEIINKAVREDRRLSSVDHLKIANASGAIAVAGNIRRSARMNQGDWDDEEFKVCKDNLWTQDEQGNWKINEDVDVFRFGNNTRLFYRRPTIEEVREAIEKQFYSGEGAIMYVPRALVNTNIDLFKTEEEINIFLECFELEQNPKERAKEYLSSLLRRKVGVNVEQKVFDKELEHRFHRMSQNPCTVGETLVRTKQGDFKIEDLVGKVVDVWDGNEWIKLNTFRVTGYNQPVYEVELYNGQSIKATEYHKFILSDGTERLLKDLKVGDELLNQDVVVEGSHYEPAAYLKGFAIGDGTSDETKPILYLYKPKEVCKSRLIDSLNELPTLNKKHNPYLTDKEIEFKIDGNNNRYRMTGLAIRNDGELLKYFRDYKKGLPIDKILRWDNLSKLNFLAGLFDSDGCACDNKNGFMYQITSISKQLLIDIQLILKSLGINSKIALNKKAGIVNFNDGYGDYNSKDCYRLTISQVGSVVLSKQIWFSRLTSFSDKQIKFVPKRNNHYKVVSILYSHVASEVYCCTVPTTNRFLLSSGVLTGNCGK